MRTNLSNINGNKAEKLALRFFKKEGYKYVSKNYYCRFGEIDLIVEKNNQLVFVEVKYRKNLVYGNPEEWVNWQKQKKIIATAQYFLQNHPKYNDYFSFRFDILAISGKIHRNNINWIKSAFIC